MRHSRTGQPPSPKYKSPNRFQRNIELASTDHFADILRSAFRGPLEASSSFIVVERITTLKKDFSGMRVRLVGYEPDLERVCAAAMRSCYSPHPGYELFTHTSEKKVLDGEKIFDAERIGGLLKRALELGHYDILEHNSITWLAEADEKEILFLMESSKFFETSQIDEQRWLITTNLRVLVELARSANSLPLTKDLVATLNEAAPIIASALAIPTAKS